MISTSSGCIQLFLNWKSQIVIYEMILPISDAVHYIEKLSAKGMFGETPDIRSLLQSMKEEQI